jgi:hypothetical protein
MLRLTSDRTRGAAVAALVGAAALLLHAAPAAADPPAPTDYRSTVTAIEPAAGAVRAEVVGGDAFLELTVDRGHEVIVDGYDGEPYLRFLPDGTVERNARSEATYLNEDRQGAVDIPGEADNDAEPDWEQVGEGGTYAWHDHRIHWMGEDAPAGLSPGDVVQSWTVDLTVDGTATAVRGELVLAEDVSPLPWLALVVVAAGAVALAGRRRARIAAAAAVVAGGLGGAVAGYGELAAAPPDVGASPLVLIVPGLALLFGILGLGAALGTLPVTRQGPALTLAAAAALLGWAVLRAEVLWTPILPTELPANADRALTALALGLAVGAAGLVVWAGGVVAPRRAIAATAGGGDTR